jgi:hypothetical protein
MNKLLTIALACCLPTGLAAEDPNENDLFLGTMSVLVMEESAALGKDALCVRSVERGGDKECMAFNRAVLTARTQRVSVLRERGRWM